MKLPIHNRKGEKIAEASVDWVDWLKYKNRKWVFVGEKYGTERNYVASFFRLEKMKFRTDYLHRLICGHRKDQVVIHINRDLLDNRRKNLKAVSRSEMSRNRLTRTPKLPAKENPNGRAVKVFERMKMML